MIPSSKSTPSNKRITRALDNNSFKRQTKNSEYDQEKTQSQTADKPVAS